MGYVGEGPPQWWLDQQALVPKEEKPKAPEKRKPKVQRAVQHRTVCNCGRDYLTVPIDGPGSECPYQVIV